MNMRFARAAFVACLLGSAAALTITAPLTPALAKPSGPTVSPAVGKLLQPAQVAMQAGDNAGALVLIKQAQALPDQTPFDTYTINNFLANAAIALKDYATADAAYEAMAESPAMPDADKPTTLHNAMLLAGDQKHYDKVIKYGTAFNALGGAPDPTVIGAMAQAYYFTNDFANATAFAQKSVDLTPAGQPPNRGALEIKLGAQIKAKQMDAAMETLETIVTYYNDADEWGQLTMTSLGVKGIKDFEALHIYRLAITSKAKLAPEDYNTAVALALTTGYPVEADAIANAAGGGAKQAAEARTRAAADRKTIAGFEKTAAASPDGQLDMKLAETLYGYGRYADAAAAARRALQKGGAKVNADETNMVLGESLLQTGDKAGAIAAFNNVKGSAAMQRAAHIWLLWANRKYT